MNYQYWIIRFVPNVARGEFTNIGIVCGADGGDWFASIDTRFIRNRGSYSSDLRELSGWTRWFRRAIADHGQSSIDGLRVSGGWIEHLRARQANAVQFSEPLPIAVESARAGVEMLFPHLVERPAIRTNQGLSRARLRADVRDTLVYEAGYTIGRDLITQPPAIVGKQRNSFDLLRAERTDGSFALTNVWAFNVKTLEVLDRDVQAWNYFVSRFRADGGQVGSEKHVRLVPGDAAIEVVLDEPDPALRDHQRRTDIFEAAREAWALSDVVVRNVDQFHRAAAELTPRTESPIHS